MKCSVFRRQLLQASAKLKENAINSHCQTGIDTALTKCLALAYEISDVETDEINDTSLYIRISDLNVFIIKHINTGVELKFTEKSWSSSDLDNFYTGYDDCIKASLDILK